MELDDKALRGPEVLAAFEQLRQLSQLDGPDKAGQHYTTFIPQFMKGETAS